MTEILNITAIISGFFTIFGIALTLFFNNKSKKQEYEYNIKVKKNDFLMNYKKDNIYEPILKYIETEMVMLDELFHHAIDNKYNIEDKKYRQHEHNGTIIAIKVFSLNNNELTNLFEKFNEISKQMKEPKTVSSNNNNLEKLLDIGSKILAIVYENIKE